MIEKFMEVPVKIAPSILSADFASLGQEITAMESANADWIHVDVMDGHFVPNITIGPDVVAALRKNTKLPLDVHLMVSPVDTFIPLFSEAGADIITIHQEAGPHLHRSLQMIRSLGKKAGVSINPSTPATSVECILDSVDLILVMTVNPGFGGQTFIKSQLKKIRQLRKMIDESGYIIDLEVDGGVTAENAKQIFTAGANILVAGTASFKGGPTCYTKNVERLRGV